MSEDSHQRNEFKRMLDRYAAGTCSADEKKLVEQWYEGIGAGNRLLVNDLQRQQIEARLWKKIAINSAAKPAAKRQWARIAATVSVLALAAASAFFIHRSQRNTMASATSLVTENYTMQASNEGSTIKTIVLEDGTTVILQPHSYLLYSDFKPEKREVKLIGAAFFEVSHDQRRPFLVYSKDVITRVLGTSFSIDAHQDDAAIIVSVKTGRVSVSRPSASTSSNHTDPGEVILTPNQKAIFDLNQNKLTTTLTDNPQPIQRTEEGPVEMNFDEEQVIVILHRLEEVYGVRISFDEQLLESCVLTTVFSGESLYERLKIICKAIGGTFETKGTSIIIQSRGCKELNPV